MVPKHELEIPLQPPTYPCSDMTGPNRRLYTIAVFVTGVLVTVGVDCLYSWWCRFQRSAEADDAIPRAPQPKPLLLQDRTSKSADTTDRAASEEIVQGIEGCIGNTPLIRIKSLSAVTGCDILAKAEVRNRGNQTIMMRAWTHETSSSMEPAAVPRIVWLST